MSTQWKFPVGKVSICFLIALCLLLGVSLTITQSQLQSIRTIYNDIWDKANHRLMLSAWVGGATANTTFETETTILNDVWDQTNHYLKTNGSGGGGSGDVSSNTATSIDNEVVLFSGTGGKTVKRASTTGLAKLTSGVLSGAVAGTDYVAPGGLAGTATALAANPANCGAGLVMLGSGIDASGAPEQCLPLSTVNAQSSTYQVVAADFNTYALIPVATGTFTITLVASGSQPTVGKYIWISNYGSGVITIARSGQLINGAAANLTLAAGSASAPTSMMVQSDGTNYLAVVVGGGGSGSGTVTTGATSQGVRYTGAGTTVGPSTGLTMDTTSIVTTKNKVTSISSNTTLDQHNMVLCTSGSGTVVATLPSASTATAGRYTLVKADTGTGICQLARAGSDTFNGLAGPMVLTRQYDAVQVDLVDAGSPGIWWVTAFKAQWGYHPLPIKAADLPSSNAAVIDVSESRPKLLFDASTSWCAKWTVHLNPDYGTSGRVVYTYSMTSATTGSAMMDWSMWKTTGGEAVDAEVESFATANTCTDAAVPGTAGRSSQITCLMTNDDGAVANDVLTFKACRNMTDTASGNLELLAAQFQYLKQ